MVGPADAAAEEDSDKDDDDDDDEDDDGEDGEDEGEGDGKGGVRVKRAAASMTVACGSFSDPMDMQVCGSGSVFLGFTLYSNARQALGRFK